MGKDAPKIFCDVGTVNGVLYVTNQRKVAFFSALDHALSFACLKRVFMLYK